MHSRIIIAFLFFLLFCESIAQNSKENIVGITLSIQSKILNDEREIQVFLPDSYSKEGSNFPVLYILDGQRYFLHAVSLLKSFGEFKQTPEFIIVGISKKSSDRNRNFSINSVQYLNFIKNEVIDYMDREFRTTSKRMLFGWAYAGGFVMETMTVDPYLFDVLIAASPFPLKGKINKIDSLLTENTNFANLLYFSSGINEGEVKEGTNMLNALLKNKAPQSMTWVFNELEGEEHRSTPFTTLYHGIKEYFFHYPELQFSSLTDFYRVGGLPFVYEYYQKRASQFGFTNELSDWTMFSLTRNAIRANDYDQFHLFVNLFTETGFIERLSISRSSSIASFYLEKEQYDEAINIYSLLAAKNPEASGPLIGLGDTYMKMKNETMSKFYYDKAKKLSEK